MIIEIITLYYQSPRGCLAGWLGWRPNKIHVIYSCWVSCLWDIGINDCRMPGATRNRSTLIQIAYSSSNFRLWWQIFLRIVDTEVCGLKTFETTSSTVCEEFVKNLVDSIYKYYIQIVKYLVWDFEDRVSGLILDLSIEQLCQSGSLTLVCFCLFNLMQTTYWIFTTTMYLAKNLAW